MGRVTTKNGFPETTSHKIYETSSSFHVKKHTAGKL